MSNVVGAGGVVASHHNSYMGGHVVSNQPLTASMAAHLQKMQRRALIMQNMSSTQNLVLQTQSMSLSQQNLAAAAAVAAGHNGWQSPALNVTPNYTQQLTAGQRRASDPVRPLGAQTAPALPMSSTLQRHHSFSNVQQPVSNSPVGRNNSGAGRFGHPNEGVVLEEVGEGHMVEEKLVVPDEMLQYLNQVNSSF